MAATDDSDIQAILSSLYQVGPTAEERRRASSQSLARMGLGILAANQPSREPRNPLGVLAAGGIGGMDAYQADLQRQMQERKAGAAMAMQGLQIKKQIAQQRALAQFADEQSGTPQVAQIPAGQLALTAGAAEGDIGPTQSNLKRIEAFESAPAVSRQVPNFSRLLANDVDPTRVRAMMEDWKLRNPDLEVIQSDTGKEIIYRDKRTMKELGRVPKQGGPGTVPFEASDIAPSAYRDFLINRGKAGATSVTVQPDNLGLKPRDRFDMEGKLRDDFRANPTVKAADEMASAFTLIKSAYERPSAANDLAMATKYMKILDPTSVVRESEFALAVNATGLLDKVQNYAASVLEGKKLNPAQREDFYKSAQAINESFQAERDKIASRFGENATQYNLSPRNVIGSPRAPDKKDGVTNEVMDNKPPAAQHRGRVIEDEAGKRFKSDGLIWKPL